MGLVPAGPENSGQILENSCFLFDYTDFLNCRNSEKCSCLRVQHIYGLIGGHTKDLKAHTLVSQLEGQGILVCDCGMSCHGNPEQVGVGLADLR